MSVNPLPNGTIITSGKTSCVLGNCISRGGSCFVYEVDSIDGNSRRCLIKEACPNGPYLLAREGAEICAEDARSKAALDACRESVRQEQEIGAAIDALTRKTAGSWEIIRADQIVIGENAFPAGEAVFALLPKLSGHGAFVRDLDRDITVAVMGCVVNGPGEAREADYGIAGGKDRGLLFKKGQVLGTYDYDQLCDALMALIREDEGL